MNINEENKDLIENRIPWGLLDEETQERMLGWKYGWSRCFQYETPSGWITTNLGYGTRDCEVYRAKPAPTVNKSYPPEVSALISAILEKRLSAQLDGDNSVFEAMVSLISLWDAKRGENE